MKILVYPARDGGSLEAVRLAAPGAEVVAADGRDEALAEIPDAQVLFGEAPPELLAAAQRLEWIQAPVAGLERYVTEALKRHPAVLTNARGIYNDHIADHAMALLLAFARDLPRLWRRQRARRWAAARELSVTHLPDATLGIIGLGGIGRALAHRARASGLRILAVDPSVTDGGDDVDEVVPPARLDRVLTEADYVAVCAPHTPETEGLIGAAQLARMQPNTVLINIARGIIVDQEALTEALLERRIAGAALDVFQEEPLPPDHPLWELPNVIITPHVAWMGADTEARRLELFIANLRRYLAGEPLLNVVDKKRLYVPGGDRYNI